MVSGRDSSGASREGIEISAKTVEEAVAQALRRLRLSREEVDVEVLHAGSPGRLLGFGAEPARVLVRPRAGAAAGASDVTGDVQEPGDLLDDDEDGDLRSRSAEDDDLASDENDLAGVGDASDVGDDEERIPENLAGEAELARLMLAELLNRMGVDEATVEVAETDPITLNIRSDDPVGGAGGPLADLIGRRGETLRAIQFILSLMLNKQLRRRLRVYVDVDGYRARREDLLRSMAQRFAYRVRQTREPMQLETMPPNERRIIHMVLADDPDVMTESIGEGDNRRVVIKPRR